jgi:hypothetical protein
MGPHYETTLRIEEERQRALAESGRPDHARQGQVEGLVIYAAALLVCVITGASVLSVAPTPRTIELAEADQSSRP